MRLCERLITFQSHAGSIEVPEVRPHAKGVGLSFNPTLVRLRCSQRSPEGLHRSGFNPTLVRLRFSSPMQFENFIVCVSIPRWFD